MLKRILAMAAILLGVAAIALWVISFGPHGEPKPSVTDGISAIGQAAGAIGTAGALWVGAVTFLRQVQDQHRAQAATVTVHVGINGGIDDNHTVHVTLGSELPIYNMQLVCYDSQGTVLELFSKHVVVREFSQYIDEGLPLHDARATFTDSTGVRWTRWSKGRLEEIGRRPKSFSIEETSFASYEEHNRKLQEKKEQKRQAST